MNSLTDHQLLREYAECRSEAAFAELVRRYVDFVHSAALRIVCDAHLAEDVTQSVFVALARSAGQVATGPVLSGWLHQTTRNLAANVVRSDVRRRAREQEAAAMNDLHATEPEGVWGRIASVLDAALGELSGADRDALLLRYFERKSSREMARILGTSEEAAQKRVNRAVERLRERFVRRGLAVGASGLVAVISANAVHGAPLGLAGTISASAVLAGSAAQTSAAIAGTKLIAMTMTQKIILGATLTIAVGTGMYEARQVSTLRGQVQTIQQQEARNAAKVDQLNRERDDAMTRQAALEQENERLRQESADLPKLRAEVTRLRAMEQQFARSKSANQNAGDPFTQSVLGLITKAAELNRHLEQMPDKKIPELQLLAENDWLNAVKDAQLDTEADVRKALSNLRSNAKAKLPIGSALHEFTGANDGRLPTDLAQLKPYFKPAIDDAILDRYKLLHTGNLSDFPAGTWFVAEKAPVDKDYDSRAKFGIGASTVIGTGIGEAGDPEDKSY